MDYIRDGKDSSGRSYETYFLALPDTIDPKPNSSPEFPIFLGDIRAKLDAYQYSSLGALKTDFRRMIASAFEFYREDQIACEHAKELSNILLEYKADNQRASYDSYNGASVFTLTSFDKLHIKYGFCQCLRWF